jgi:hypothetical protein
LRDERRLRVFENMVLWRIFGFKRDELAVEWRKIHNEELNDLYSSSNTVRVMRWAGHLARMGERTGIYGDLVEKPEGKRTLGRPSRRWEDNIKLYIPQVGYAGMGWIELARDRDRWRELVNAAMNLWVL